MLGGLIAVITMPVVLIADWSMALRVGLRFTPFGRWLAVVSTACGTIALLNGVLEVLGISVNRQLTASMWSAGCVPLVWFAALQFAPWSLFRDFRDVFGDDPTERHQARRDQLRNRIVRRKS